MGLCLCSLSCACLCLRDMEPSPPALNISTCIWKDKRWIQNTPGLGFFGLGLVFVCVFVFVFCACLVLFLSLSLHIWKPVALARGVFFFCLLFRAGAGRLEWHHPSAPLVSVKGLEKGKTQRHKDKTIKRPNKSEDRGKSRCQDNHKNKGKHKDKRNDKHKDKHIQQTRTQRQTRR